ncbi:flagellar basal-body MS-ring/collar protein FliF [Candidatus Odyssella thessalonicensis]|uniref:flagellar basal-body MS-ring/collar protein FliF n=1 Tax=Candidatus Odyssella thessalonicensis TaxID=84647 RepID=UPI000225BDAE|nr:flagellar basal-body MS-ring/collar protein FliF [Candidatus Odyssella thessalonicensis]
MDGFAQILRNLGPIRLAAIGSVMLGVTGFFIYLMSQTSTGGMGILYSQVDPADGARIVQKLESMGVPVNISPDGTTIYAPAEKIARLRMDVAQEGLPSGGALGYEIFDRGDILSTSGSLIDINKLRALEGELTKSIKTINGVAAARVHLVVPKRELFSRDKVEPSASIMLKMKGVTRLSDQQVKSIQYLVASAVPSLPVDRISIVDDRGTLLARGTEGEGAAQNLTVQQEARRNYEVITGKQIESLLERTLGVGKIRAEISADIDFDQVVVNSEKYDPDGQVARSTSNSNEDASSTANDGTVTVANALPNAGAGGQGQTDNKNKRADENINYEISRTVETHKKEAGQIKSLSVAVLVDGTYVKGSDGKETYTPRTKEEIDQITKLVKTAIGFKQERGDRVEVINMQFAKSDLDNLKAEDPSTMLPQMDVTKIIELAVLAAVGVLILIMIVRPVLLRVIESSGVASEDSEIAALLANANGRNYVALPDFTKIEENQLDLLSSSEEEEDEDMLDISNIDGRLKASSLKKIAEIIDKHPEEAVTIIRNWMYEEPWKQEKTT